MNTTHDVDFFNLVHDLLLVPGADDPDGERRDRVRRPYEYRQLISPYQVDGELPNQTTFRPVVCCDISPGGMSFRTVHRPDYERLVVALGKVPFTFIEARVVHVTKSDDDRPEEFLVGCRFEGRILD